MKFDDRRDAGRQLAARLGEYARRDDVVVLGLPRGGMPVAFEVANSLGAPLDIFLVRKLGVPGRDELAMGAVASGGTHVLNEDVISAAGVEPADLQDVLKRELGELQQRERRYRSDRAQVELSQRVVIVVDDGLATGATMRAAVAALHERDVRRIVVAIPTASADICASLRAQVSDVVCLWTPETFRAVGQWYRDFTPTTDDEVGELLGLAGYRGDHGHTEATTGGA
jgi:predicted phosphoribosyltransferase